MCNQTCKLRLFQFISSSLWFEWAAQTNFSRRIHTLQLAKNKIGGDHYLIFKVTEITEIGWQILLEFFSDLTVKKITENQLKLKNSLLKLTFRFSVTFFSSQSDAKPFHDDPRCQTCGKIQSSNSKILISNFRNSKISSYSTTASDCKATSQLASTLIE